MHSEQSNINIPFNQNYPQNESNFRTLGKISEEEKIEMIKTGFSLDKELTISLKKYYEGGNEVDSLSELRGYQIKYETIRCTKLDQNLINYHYP